MTGAEPVGVLVMAYGTAAGPDDVERYYTDIRGGRPPSPEHLEELKARYAAIGNRFPLLEITRRQAEGLEEALNEGDGAFRTYLGMKHSRPSIPDAVDGMRSDGIERAVGLVMAPHWSAMSIEDYVSRVERAVAERGGPSFTFVRHWHDHPAFLDLLADRVEDAVARAAGEDRDGIVVIFSAHSLPQRTLDDGNTRCLRCDLCPAGCRYAAQLEETAALVAVRLRLPAWRTAWQSAGRTPHPWLGPTVEDAIAEAAREGRRGVVVCSAGFVADHLEILYDLDVEARNAAERAGLAFARTEMPNDDPRFTRMLATVVREQLASEMVASS